LALRYANVYGPRQDPHGEAGVVAIFCGQMLAGKPVTIVGDGRQTRDYVYVGDVARASLAALDSASGALNISTGIETDVNQLHRVLAHAAGIEATAIHVAARAGEQRRSVITPARAARELDWRPVVELEEGLRRTFQYFKQRLGA
ncbi:MAG: NAD-dependent epimerase/dehydratase family protein, partial [Candidatus Binataceae bacterium]